MELHITSVTGGIYLNLAEKLMLWYFQFNSTLQVSPWSQHKLIHVHIT